VPLVGALVTIVGAIVGATVVGKSVGEYDEGRAVGSAGAVVGLWVGITPPGHGNESIRPYALYGLHGSRS